MAYLALIICFLASVLITPLIKKLAIRIGAVDKPNGRKVHTRIMPRLGGLAIFISFMIGFLLFQPGPFSQMGPLLLGALIITAIGVWDDMKELSAKVKFSGQLVAALLVVLSGIRIDYVTLPFMEQFALGYFAIPLSVLWIVAITNAINLIDGLDGLAAGVSSIVLLTISGMAIVMGPAYVAFMGFIVLGSTLGFLLYNFHPAKIFMGDTGALFLGYMISVLSIMGLFKNVTLVSIIVPVIILGVPILDTLFAIVRRIVHKKPLSSPDKLHLHHCLIRLGYSHRQTVVSIYALSALFSIAAILFTRAALWGSTLTLVLLVLMVELIVEITGLVSDNYRPILKIVDNYKTKKQY